MSRSRASRRRTRLGRTSVVVVVAAVTATGWALHRPQAAGSAGDSVAHSSAPASSAAGAGAGAGAGASRPTPTTSKAATSPCSRNGRSKLVVVSIRQQHAWACEGRRTVMSSPVTTGASSRAGDATPTGTFAVQGLNRNTVLHTSADGAYPVKFWVPFHLGVWGFHDASWQKIPFGSQAYRTRGSHGCVHVPMRTMRWLFHWLRYGTPVRIT